MTIGYIDNPNKLIHQNKAEILDGYEGCLLDNMLYTAKRGLFVLYESYLNPNASRYLFKFARTPEEMTALETEFYERMEAAENDL